MTGSGNEAIAVESFKKGVIDYIVKDAFFKYSVVEAIEEAIGELETT